MSYQVLARTYRSNTFDEVVGQGPIATTLKNAITSGRVHHGYLFTGTRGVGKTSMARILAKALNCLAFDAPTITPCCQCESCIPVSRGDDVDVVEIDAASNTGVDHIREIRSNATLRPARARFKVYIIDEVHMLSSGAFNALLKTLEEPPSHVKFILATTESHKLPATIVSRCQRFDFRAIGADAIGDHLQHILRSEDIKAEDVVIRRIARLANGSMRDALSLLDKLLSYESRNLTAAVVDEIIPPAHDELAADVIQHVADADAAGALAALDRALQTGRTIERFADRLIDHLRTLMVMRVCGEDTELVDASGPLRPALAAQAAKFDGPTYVYMISLLEELRRNIKNNGAARSLADAAIVRLAMAHQFTDLDELLAGLERGGMPPTTASPTPSKKKDRTSPAVIETETAATDKAAPPAPTRGASSTERAEPAAASPGMSSAEWQRAARDPVVQRIKEAVDGTILDVRPAPQPEDSAPDDTGSAPDEKPEPGLFSTE